MIEIIPFKGTRPFNEDAKNLIAPSTDHLSIENIEIFKKNNYWNYLKVLNPVGQLKESDSLIEAKLHFDEMKKNEVVKKDLTNNIYIYQIEFNNHKQLGILSLTFIDDSVPAKGDGTSILTLSVSNSTKGSSESTSSPTCLSHLATVASVTDSPKDGTKI